LRTVESRDDIVQEMREKGFCLVEPRGLGAAFGVSPFDLHALDTSWNDLPRDAYLKDGGKYRSRRHSSYVQALQSNSPTEALTIVPHRAHWQPVDYNALHGGIERWFEPVASLVNAAPCWNTLLIALGQVFAEVRTESKQAPMRWFIEVHQFRIDTAEGIGRPTPEGAHRDGVDFVAVILVNRRGIKGGETRVFDADGPSGVRFTLTEPWSVLLLDDARVIHESTPIQPDGVSPEGGARDTLVLTYRANGFQDPV
jgi:hypothetical protein